MFTGFLHEPFPVCFELLGKPQTLTKAAVNRVKMEKTFSFFLQVALKTTPYSVLVKTSLSQVPGASWKQGLRSALSTGDIY